MWITIGILAGIVFLNTMLLWVLYYRMRAAEAFLMVMSAVVLGGHDQDEIRDYIKSQIDHPAGRKLPKNGAN